MASKRTSTDLVEGHDIRIRAAGVDLSGDLAVPPAVAGVVVFAHGTGSGRHSPRNQRVAARLQEHGFATLLLDLLTSREEQEDERTGRLRFDVGLLARRLAAAADWTRRECPSTLGLPVGYFGASTGAAAALIAAAEHPEGIEAIVSRGGRPDLALQHLGRVGAPTLLIVGQRDSEVSAMNETAFRELPVEKDLVIVPGAGHLFEEPGALDEVARLAADWFDGHLVAAGHTIGGARSAPEARQR